MFNLLFKGLSTGLAVGLLRNYRRASLHLLRIEGAKCYVRGLQMARLSVIGLVRLSLMLGLIGGGVVLFHAGLFILLPLTLKAKAILSVLLGVGYIVIGALALRVAMDEKVWLEQSGAAKLLDAAIRPPSQD